MEFENFLMLGDMKNMMSCLPFSGAHKLPTADQVLKLYLVFRDLEKYQRTTISEVSDMVSRLVVKYWVMANIPTVELRTITSRVVKLVEKYNKLVKLKAK